MTTCLISIQGEAMDFPEEDVEAVARDARADIEEAKATGVSVSGGGIDEGVPPVLVADPAS